MKFEFNERLIKLPWQGWEFFELSPEGIRTPRGFFSPAQLDVLLFKSAFYDRGLLEARGRNLVIGQLERLLREAILAGVSEDAYERVLRPYFSRRVHASPAHERQ